MESNVSQYPSRRHCSQAGMSLVEVLVAVTIFSVILMTTFMLYERSQRAYLRTEADTTQQQNVRFVMDQVVNTLRDAGANVNPAGETRRADEQIEAAFEAAVFVRGDFDNTREAGLEGTAANQFPMVSTGNDEIVGFVLTKADPALNTQTITIKTDLTGTGGAAQRDAAADNSTVPPTVAREETRTINVAALTVAQQTNPPYRLERVSFDAAGNVVTQVIAENVFRMQFDYFPDPITAASPTTQLSAATLGAADAERANRRNIRRIGVNLIGMSDRVDLALNDTGTYPATGTVATTPASYPADSTKRRKFSLAEEVTTENVGRKGRPHSKRPVAIIAQPNYLQACNGNCNFILLSWGAVTGINTYMLKVNAPAQGSLPAIVDRLIPISGTENKFMVDEPPPGHGARAYTFAVAARDAASGTLGAYTTPVSVTAQEGANNTPMGILTPANAAPVGGANAIQVDWTAVTQNAAALSNSCVVSGVGGSSSLSAPANQLLADLATYEVYRATSNGLNASFPVSASNRVDNRSFGLLINIPPGANTVFTDKLAAPCENYYYRVQPVDTCGNAPVTGASPGMSSHVSFTSADPPTVPTSLETLSSGTSGGGNHSILLKWNPVITTQGGAPVAVARYQIERLRKVSAAGAFVFDAVIDKHIADPATSLHEHMDVVPADLAGVPLFYSYKIKALYLCGPQSALSTTPYVFPCAVTGSVSITAPTAGQDFDPPGTIAITVRANGATFNGVDGEIVDAGNNVQFTFTSAATVTAGNSYTFSWLAGTMVDQTLRVTAVGRQITGGNTCTTVAAPVLFDIVNASACFTFRAPPVFNPAPPSDTKFLEFQLTNNCPTAQRITGLNLSFAGGPFGTNQIKKVQVGGTDFDDGTRNSNVPFLFNKPAGAVVNVAAGASTPTFRLEFANELYKAPSTARTTFPIVQVSTSAAGLEPNMGPANP